METKEIRGLGFDAEVYHECIKKFLITPESTTDEATQRFKTDFHIVMDDNLFNRLNSVWHFIRNNNRMHLMASFLMNTLKSWALIPTNTCQFKQQTEFIINQIESMPEFKEFKYHPSNLN